MSTSPRGRILAVGLVAATLGLLPACSGGEEPDPSVSVVERAEEAIEDGAVVVDVRTPEEYESGHVQDALNIDVTAPTFAEEVAALDPQEEYVVYCRSGSRSAVAVEQMRDLGFGSVMDAGGFEDLADAGVPTR